MFFIEYDGRRSIKFLYPPKYGYGLNHVEEGVYTNINFEKEK